MEKYPKFKKNEECAFPERDNCNYDEFDIKSQRCLYMKCIRMGVWHCIFNKNQSKSEHNLEKDKGEKSKIVV